MDRLIYTALSGMDAAMTRQRMNANNLANAQTPGFRAEMFATTFATIDGASLRVRAPAQGAVRAADLGGGRVTPTGRELDIAIGGDALMAVQARDGKEAYTRRGDLRISASGVLENGVGLAVIGESGSISVPQDARITISGDGRVLAQLRSAPETPPQEIGRIKLASPQGFAIAKSLDNLLRVSGGGVLPADPTARVTSGALEQSNVDAARIIVEMIEAQRGFEQRSSIIQTAEQIDQAGARLMSLGSQ